jgi:PBSX family phage terminase large subunit
MERAPTVVRYEPHGAALELFKTRASEVAIAGPAGTGKSLACLYRLHLAALNNPGIRALILRKTAVSLGSTTLVTFEKKVAPEALKTGLVKWFGGSAREAACYRYSNGSVIVVGGMDKPEKVLSSEYDLVFADEATELSVTDWETVGTRLRNGKLSWQQQIAACNPSAPTHWIKQRADHGPMTMLHSRHRDNPAYYDPDGELTAAGVDYMGKLEALTGVRRERLFHGRWAAAEGLVYEGYDPAVHVVEKLPEGSEHWARWWVVDFGYSNPFVCQFWAEDGDGRLWLYREIYKTQTLVEDHAKDILRIVRKADGTWKEPKPRSIICDHDAEDRATLQRHLGLGTIPAHKSVSDGIQAVQSRLKVAKDGKPRVYFCRNALVKADRNLLDAKKPTSTLDEIVGYVWPQDVKPDKRENPIKEDDHGMDCLRYMTAERDLRARPNIRWM